VESLPPARSTALSRSRLRRAAWLFVALGCAAGTPSGASARSAPVRVLVGTSVSQAARDSMSPALWAKLVANYVNAQTIPFSGDPTLDDCHNAKAAYMLDAPFELRPRLPGMVNSEGRVAALTHLVVTNCVTADIVFDQVILLDSDPPTGANAGDFESVPEISWAKVVPQELGRYPVFFPRVARIKSVRPPFAYIDLGGTAPLKINDVLRVFANPSGEKRIPVLLTVTSTDTKYVQVIFSTTSGDPAPEPGDYVEPVQNPPASPKPSAAPKPAASPTRPARH
jgi:hypothetical protein